MYPIAVVHGDGSGNTCSHCSLPVCHGVGMDNGGRYCGGPTGGVSGLSKVYHKIIRYIYIKKKKLQPGITSQSRCWSYHSFVIVVSLCKYGWCGGDVTSERMKKRKNPPTSHLQARGGDC